MSKYSNMCSSEGRRQQIEIEETNNESENEFVRGSNQNEPLFRFDGRDCYSNGNTKLIQSIQTVLMHIVLVVSIQG